MYTPVHHFQMQIFASGVILVFLQAYERDLHRQWHVQH